MLSGWTLTTWMDIVFSHLTHKVFPNPKAVNRDLHIRGFHSAWMIDPGAKVDPNYFVYKSGTENDVWVKLQTERTFMVMPGQERQRSQTSHALK